MLKSLIFRFGSSGSPVPLEFDTGPMTVFVGPNNAGKSLTLREIEDFLETGGQCERRILDGMEFELPTVEEARGMLEARRIVSERADVGAGRLRVSRIKPMADHVKKRATDIEGTPEEQTIHLERLLHLLAPDVTIQAADVGFLCREFLALFTLRLDGQTRLALTYPRPASDLSVHPANHLAALFQNEAARERIREITADAFGLYFVLDPTGMTNLRIRMSERPPTEPAEEQGLDNRARAFHARATDIAELSDGLKAFTGLAAAVLSADYRIMLVDEPEAFLHPPLSRKLGKRLTELAAERDASVLASTHSPEFVMGCVQSGKQVNIVRLSYKKGVPSATLLTAGKLASMMRDPLLRSTGILGALFHDGAIVCEADADRVFYQEVNERLLGVRRGADGCIFLNAQNKQTIRRIIRPLREMGIPAAAVVDLDILKGKEDFRDLLRAGFVPDVFMEPWERMRTVLDQALRGDVYKQGGVHTLSKETRATADLLLDSLAMHGIFLVPTGELESWLPALEVGGHGPEWLTAVFDRMGTDRDADGYLRPSEGGVWRFVERIGAWVADPHRQGMRSATIAFNRLLAPPREEAEAGEEPQPGEEPEPRVDAATEADVEETAAA